MPELIFSEKDEDEFVECVATGRPFSKTFEFGKTKKFRLRLKDRSKKVSEIIGRSLDIAMEDKKILNWVEYTHMYNSACLYYQTEAINGIEHIRLYPKSVFEPFDLISAMEKSPINDWTSAQLYVGMGFMFQFNQALSKLSQKAFTSQNFS